MTKALPPSASPPMQGGPAFSRDAMPGVPAADFAAFRARNRYGSLDGLRFLCIVAVLWHHGPIWGALANGPRILGRGFLGVDFFFVLSGFLITTLLLREQAFRGRFSLRAFYWRRFLRIIPVYFLLVSAASVWFVLVKGQGQYAQLVPFYYLFLANFLTADIPLLAPTWSLSVEEQYYFIWPLLLGLLPSRTVLPVLGLLVAVNVAGIMGAFAPLGIHAIDIGPLHLALPAATYAPILMGSALAVILRGPQGFAWCHAVLGSRAAAPALLALLLVLVSVLPADLRGLPNLAIHLVMTALLAALVLREDNGLAAVLRLRPVARVGEVSYGIYLYHLIGLQLATMLMPRLGLGMPWAVQIVYPLISILIAEISYRSLEAWVRRYRSVVS
ncbi:MAG: acyltransferase family protein [Cypionkella sp.]